jgi:hypothetical protein
MKKTLLWAFFEPPNLKERLQRSKSSSMLVWGSDMEQRLQVRDRASSPPECYRSEILDPHSNLNNRSTAKDSRTRFKITTA